MSWPSPGSNGLGVYSQFYKCGAKHDQQKGTTRNWAGISKFNTIVPQLSTQAQQRGRAWILKDDKLCDADQYPYLRYVSTPGFGQMPAMTGAPTGRYELADFGLLIFPLDTITPCAN